MPHKDDSLLSRACRLIGVSESTVNHETASLEADLWKAQGPHERSRMLKKFYLKAFAAGRKILVGKVLKGG